MDVHVENLYPDTDCILITIGDNQVAISVSREEGGLVAIQITDNEDGSEYRAILGQDGFTHKL